MNLDRARSLVAEALKEPFENIPDDARMGEYLGWDSIGHMEIVLLLEEKIGQVLNAEETLKVQSLADIAQLLTRYGAK